MNTKLPTSIVRLGKGATFRLACGRVQTRFLAAAVLAGLGIATTVRADRVGHDVSAGHLQVDPNPPGNTADDNTNCFVSVLVSVNDLRTNTFNRGDYRVQIGDLLSDDLTNGVLIAAVAQNGRSNFGSNNM